MPYVNPTPADGPSRRARTAEPRATEAPPDPRMRRVAATGPAPGGETPAPREGTGSLLGRFSVPVDAFRPGNGDARPATRSPEALSPVPLSVPEAPVALRVLLLEDSPPDAALVRTYLSEPEGRAHEVTHVETMCDALEALRRSPFDVCLADLNLPDSRGVETATRILEAAPHLPLVLLTGLDDERCAVEAVQRGAQDFLRKGHAEAETLPRALRYAVERKRLQDAVLRSEERLRQSLKMEAVGRLAGGVAHDFNNILTAIIGFAELLMARLPEGSDEPSRQFVSEIRRAADLAVGVTRQLLAFGRKQMLRPAVLEVNGVLREMEALLRHLLGEDVDLRLDLDPAAGAIRVDPAQLEQVILNLALNARDAMPRGGRLTIRTGVARIDEAYAAEHEDLRPGAYAFVCVADTGSGIDEHTRAHLFEPFFTTKGAGRGTGLGLSTVYGIVKQSGGHVRVRSEVGFGSAFEVLFPRARRERDAKEAPDGVAPAGRGRETVLVVEDEDSLRRLLQHVLEAQGYRVLLARSGREALAVWTVSETPVDLLLTDVVLPDDMYGTELAKQMSSLHPSLKTLFMTGYPGSTLMEHGIEEVLPLLIPKPFTPDTVARKVREVLDARPVA